MTRSRLSIVGNLIVLAVVVAGGWLLWSNLNRGAGPPARAVAEMSEVAERAGFGDTNRAPRSRELQSGTLSVAQSGLAVPVKGVGPGDLLDTFTQSRAGGARVHNAIDIMAPRGQPVISVAPGTVEKLFYSRGGGGITAYVRSPDGKWMYYYAHLDAYAPGLREGQQVARGTPIGTVGISGNSDPDGPHLHFSINRMAPGEKWYEGTPINPYPLLAGKRAAS